jgi:hypothetical protein
LRRFLPYNEYVAAQFDLTLTPLYRIKGQERPTLPGLLAFSPPRRAARSRRDDHLVIYLSLSGNAPLPASEYNQVASQMAERFYQNAGALTSALRATIETLNQTLYDRNMRSTSHGQYLLGRLIVGIMREAQFVFVQCGPTHIYSLSSEKAKHFHDPDISGRGLGVSQTTPLYYNQVDLHPDDLFVLCAEPPSGWSEALENERGSPSPDSLRRKLLALNNNDLNAALIQARPGNGIMRIFSAARPAVETATPLTTPSPARPITQPVRATPPPSGERGPTRTPASTIPLEPATPPVGGSDLQSNLNQPPDSRSDLQSELQQPPVSRSDWQSDLQQPPAKKLDGQPAQQAQEPQGAHVTQAGRFVRPMDRNRPTSSPVPAQRPPAKGTPPSVVAPRDTSSIREISRPTSRRGAPLFRGIARGLQAVRGFLQAISNGFRKILPRLLPNPQESEREFSSVSTLAFIAIAAPLLLVTVAAMVYVRFGRPSQYSENYQMAVQAAVGAVGQTDPAVVRHAWESTIYYLDKAEEYQVTAESQSLRWEAQSGLDNLDRIVRVNFQPAIINGLAQTVRVRRMAATDSDLYLLDGSSGNVLHAVRTNQGYDVDPEFQCTPGVYEKAAVGGLVDILVLNSKVYAGANLLGIDAAGNLLYCANRGAAYGVPLPAPGLGWKSIAAATLDTDSSILYVLDPAGNAVWSYFWVKNKFDDPNMFFGAQVPQGMNTAIDLAARGEDLYLLFNDGHVTTCVGGGRCVDPALFDDPRAGHHSGATLSDAVFSQMLFAGPSDPSLYMLASWTKAVYRFSISPDKVLSLQSQFQANAEQRNSFFSSPVTAMAISPNRYIFLSVENQVYFATDVP